MKRVAIVGMSFRFPGTSRATYWSDLLAGRDLVSEIDPARWALDTFRHPSRSNRGTSYSFAAGTLGDVSGFDAGFFGISPREAAQMDPQQRLMLELGWEAFENSGIKPSSMRGSDCGVYVGISSGDYGMRMAEDLSAVDSLMITGNTSSIAANRISYVFDLRGPSMALDTACSSSLVAFHQACRAIQSGECAVALAGGVSLHLHPLGFVAFSKASMLSRKGRCNVFDAAGDGYVRSEGGGVFLLKDLDQALADGDHIWAIVAGSAVNTDGRKSGLTVPSGRAQSSLLTQAYKAAAIDPADIAYIEAHGTGTPVGDPIETSALGNALGQHRPQGRPLLIGSVKSNLGHLEAASGVAGLVKALHCLQHRLVPATIGLKTPNPEIRFDDWNLRVVSSNTPLASHGRLVIGVNSFGFGGANAHVILESPPPKVTAIKTRTARVPRSLPLPVLISGRTEPALKAAAAELAHFLRANPATSLYDIAATATLHREWHEHRAIAHGATHKSLALALENFATDKKSETQLVSATVLRSPVTVAFVYSGNGSQWEGMGRRLMAEDPVFKAAVLGVEQVFEKYADFSLEAEFAGKNGQGRYTRTEIAQPALFAIQVGITEMLRSRGIIPAAVTGHSVGEVAAAWACGALTLEQAVHVIFHRSQLQGTTRGEGQMTAVALGEAATTDLIQSAGLGQDVCIAGVNSARGVTLAGSQAALDALEEVLVQQAVSFKRLDLEYAFHGPLMDPIEEALRESLGGLRARSETVPFVSTVTGGRLAGSRLDADYWWRNIRQPVLFERAIQSMLGEGSVLFVEIGPHAVLKGYVDAILKDHSNHTGRTITTISRGDDAPDRVWAAGSQALLAGAPVDIHSVFSDPYHIAPLPNYPWQKEALWHAVTQASHQTLYRRIVHPLLGYRLAQSEYCWENQIDPELQPALGDHVVGGAIVFPGAAFAEIGLALATHWHGTVQAPAQVVELEELDIKSPLLMAQDAPKILRVSLDPSDGSFWIKARDKADSHPWTLHASGRFLMETHGGRETVPRFAGLPDAPPDFTGEEHLALVHAVGLEYGPAFSAIHSGWLQDDRVVARLQVPASIDAQFASYLLHPALLDAAFQLVIHLLRAHTRSASRTAYVPIRLGHLQWHRGAGRPVVAQARILRATPHSLNADFELFDAEGALVASARGVRFRSVPMRRDATDHLHLLQFVEHAMPRQGETRLAPAILQDLAAETLRNALTDLRSDPVLQAYLHSVDPLLDALCAAYAAQALGRLAGDTAYFSDEQAGQLLERHPDLAQLLVWMVSVLEEDGVLTRGPAGWRFDPDKQSPEPDAIWKALMAEHADHFSLIHAVARAGMHLPDLFDGAAEPARRHVQALTIHTAMAEMFGQSAWWVVDRTLARIVNDGLGQLPRGQRLRVAEFSSLAPRLGSVLLQGEHSDNIDLLTVSGHQVPGESTPGQGDPAGATLLPGHRRLAPGQAPDPAQIASFDMAIMAQAFDSPASLLQALRLARQLLAPGGVLIFLGLPEARWPQLVFGSNPAWWAEDTGPGRRQAMGSGPAWQQWLEEEGFAVQANHALADPATGWSSAAPSIIVATSRALVADALPPPAQERATGAWLMLVRNNRETLAFSTRLAALMHGLGLSCTPVLLDGPGDWTDQQSVSEAIVRLRSEHGGIAGLIDLPDLGPAAQYALDAIGQPDSARVERVAALVQACHTLKLHLPCWFVCAQTSGLPSVTDAALRAFARSVRNEPTGLDARVIQIDTGAQRSVSDHQALALTREILAPDQERELTLTSDGARFVPRLRHAPRYLSPSTQDVLGQNVRLGVSLPGQLRNLRWETGSLPELGPLDLRIEVQATGLNFRDVMYALGMLSDEAVEAGFAGASLGLECAGIVSAAGPDVRGFAVGDRVLAFGGSCFGRWVTTRESAAAHLPGSMSMEAAATIPTTFFTAYYALHHLARLGKGESVLIHGGAGGVGIAAIQLARHWGAEVFATAGSDEKRDFLRLLGADHVLDSRTLAFSDQILQLTGGRGVDVVLNSLAGEAINRNLRILKPFGRFLELGKRDFYENTRIGLRPFRNNISYFGIDADQLLVAQPAVSKQLFQEVMALFTQGVLHPLPYMAFEADHVVDAFRHMQQARHIGKVVVTYHRGTGVVQPPPQPGMRLQLREAASYLVTGGLGGFGLRTAQWLVDKGARHLVLVSRTGPGSSQAREAIARWESQGVSVRAIACDVSEASAVQALIQSIQQTMPPLRGIVHAAAVFDDALTCNTDAERLRKVFAPKALGAWHLHHHSLRLPLDFFILYSSVTSAFGNPGQAAYVAANASLEALALARRAHQLPALCVQWGPIDDVGYLARNTQVRDALQSRTGGHAMRSAVALDILEELILTDRTNLCVADINWRVLSRFLPSAVDPMYRDMAGTGAEHESVDEQPQDIAQMLAELSPEELASAFRGMLKNEIGEILRIAPEKIDDNGSVYDLGLDSLMGVELALAIESRFGAKLPVMVLNDSPTVAKLADRIIAQLKGAPAGDDTPERSDLEVQVHSTASQHAVQVDAETIGLFAGTLETTQSVGQHKRIIH